MKKSYPILIAVLAFTINITTYSQPAPEKKLLATLGPEESLAYGENCFMMDKDPGSFSFVTVVYKNNEKNFYCYGKDGKKTGPVKDPDPNYWNACENYEPASCQARDEQNSAGIEKYLDVNTGGINFNGQKYGPYGQIMLFNLAPGDKGFCALALSSDMKLVAFDNLGHKIEPAGSPEKIIISPDGKTAYIKMQGTLNPFAPDAYQKMLDNPEEMNNPKVYLWGMDGKKYGPFNSSDFNSTWFTPSGQWVIYANSDVYLNGKVLFHTDASLDKCDIWISPDGKNYAWADYDKISFSDGSKYSAPIAITFSKNNGKGVLKWVTLENEKDLVYYKKTF